MIKKITLLVTAIAVGGLLYFGLNKMKIAQKEDVDLYSKVPKTAIAIIEIQDPAKQWANLLSNNIIWEELQVFNNIHAFNNVVAELDSTFSNLSVPNVMETDHILISILPTKDESLEILYQIKLETTIEPEQLAEYLIKVFQAKVQTRNDSGYIELKLTNHSLFIQADYGLISFSLSPQVISQLNLLNADTDFIIADKNFNTVRKTSSKGAKTRVFVYPQRLINTLDSFTNSKTQLKLALFPDVSSWIELDTEIKPDEVSMNGFATTSDSSNHWVSLFKNQDPIAPRVVDFLPNRTAFILHFGFSDFLTLRTQYVKRKSDEMGSQFDLQLMEWDTAYDISIQEHFLSWIDNELALTIMEPDQTNFQNEIMVWVNSSDSRALFQLLSEISLKVANKTLKEVEYITYKEHVIQKLNIPDFLKVTLGEEFQSVSENYFIRLDDYIVFANSPSILQWTINKYLKGKTLSNDSHYQAYSNRISGESNVYIYSNIASSTPLYQSFVNKTIVGQISDQKEWLQKFQVLSLQASYETDNLYFVNTYLKYNPVYKKETNSLWELPLLASSEFKPVFVKNHYTQATEIFVQDTSNTIYLIDNKGNTLWQRKIDGEIISNVTQIDALKNNKLQLTFNTKTHIYIIDRNGNDLKNFPIRLPDSASASMFIADYENNNEYRFIVPTNSGDILNYNVLGNQVKGWDYTHSNSYVSHTISYTNIKGKDYLIVVNHDGSIKALNRRGQIRLNLKSTFNFRILDEIHLQEGSQLDNTYILGVTKNQEVVRISLIDKKERLFSLNQDSIKFISFSDVDLDGAIEIIATGTHHISAFTTDGNLVFNIQTESEISYPINMYHFNNSHYIGYVNKKDNELTLSHMNGLIDFVFPMKGASPFSIMDINQDGRYNLLTTDNNGMLFNYTIGN